MDDNGVLGGILTVLVVSTLPFVIYLVERLDDYFSENKCKKKK